MPDGLPVASRDAPVGGQAVLEGVMMRGVSTWAVAVRKPDEQVEVTSEPLVSWAKRNRVLRWPVIRGVVALAESLRIGFRALAISANAQIEPEEGEEEPEPIGGFVWGLTIALSLVLAIGLFFVVPVGATSLIKDQLGSSLLFWLVEGILRTAIFIGYIVGDQPPARPAARVRVPRRRAQDDLLLRGGRPADAGAGRALLAPSPPLRHELPAGRDGGRDLRLRAARPSGLVLAAGLADPRHPADRRDLLRGDQVGGAQPPQALGAGGDVARPDAPEPDHP